MKTIKLTFSTKSAQYGILGTYAQNESNVNYEFNFEEFEKALFSKNLLIRNYSRSQKKEFITKFNMVKIFEKYAN